MVGVSMSAFNNDRIIERIEAVGTNIALVKQQKTVLFALFLIEDQHRHSSPFGLGCS